MMQQKDDAAAQVLVVDDESQIRQLLERVLKSEGFIVRTATGVDEALDALRTTRFEAVILDIRMPDASGGRRSGVDVLSFMRADEQWRSIPALILTGSVLTETEEKAILGLEAYVLSKSEGHSTLVQYVKHLTTAARLAKTGKPGPRRPDHE